MDEEERIRRVLSHLPYFKYLSRTDKEDDISSAIAYANQMKMSSDEACNFLSDLYGSSKVVEINSTNKEDYELKSMNMEIFFIQKIFLW